MRISLFCRLIYRSPSIKILFFTDSLFFKEKSAVNTRKDLLLSKISNLYLNVIERQLMAVGGSTF